MGNALAAQRLFPAPIGELRFLVQGGTQKSESSSTKMEALA